MNNCKIVATEAKGRREKDAENNEYSMLRHIQQAYEEVNKLYSSGEWSQVLVQRHSYMQYVETAIEKKIVPDEVALSQPFTL